MATRQDYPTPPEFIQAVQQRLGDSLNWDLAASPDNAKASRFFTESDDALTQKWPSGGWCWLNPPYANIRPWVQKAWEESRTGVQIVMLIPASVGSNWWMEWVTNKAYITFLNGRITFVGHTTVYPKDCALLLYAPFLEGGSCTWGWRTP